MQNKKKNSCVFLAIQKIDLHIERHTHMSKTVVIRVLEINIPSPKPPKGGSASSHPEDEVAYTIAL